MTVALLGLAAIAPQHFVPQNEAADKAVEAFALEGRAATRLKKIYDSSAIAKRHFVLEEFCRPRPEWQFWGAKFPKEVPTMGARNEIYKREAPQLASAAAKQALAQWGGDLRQISHVISVSCTGVLAPGIEFLLMDELGLSRRVERLGINFMGCFGAFKGLAVAKALVSEDPRRRVLVVCTELCSLHLQTDGELDHHVANALFADGAASAIVGGNPTADEETLWELKTRASMALQDTRSLMSWEAGDNGYIMRLGAEVPKYLETHIASFARELLGPKISFGECDWAIHPGGKAILQAIERACGLDSRQTEASWNVMAQYGTMSSATFLFVLNELARNPNRAAWCIGLGFGPGLSVEGILLQHPTQR